MTTRKGLPRGEWLKDDEPIWAHIDAAPDDSLACPAANHYLCTLPEGHRGRHIATGAQLDAEGRTSVFEVWR